ncbi:MAG: translocation/assembly module TamB domain-containing protein [Hyphomonas sp.]|nr:translocation/assembly module TamB domain-containing protein [Hyphomonas sp.]
MAAVSAFLRLLARHRLIASGVALLVILLTALFAARLWLSSDGGRAYILSRINGQEAGRYGTLQAEGLTGDVLGRLHLGRLSVRDAQGEWIVVEDISIDWSATRLLSRHVDIYDLSAASIDILRRPELSPKKPASDSRPFDISIGKVTLDDLHLAEHVAGPEANFSIAGIFRKDGEDLDARFEAEPKDAGGDRISVEARRTASGDIRLDADIAGQPGGVFASLLKLPESDGMTLTASATGDMDNATGSGRLLFGDIEAGRLSVDIRDGSLTLISSIETDRIALIPDRVRQLAGGRMDVRMESTTRLREAPYGLTARSANATLSLRGFFDTKAGHPAGETGIDLALADAQPLIGRSAALAWTGAADRRDTTWFASGKATLTPQPSAGLPFAAASGPISVEVTPEKASFRGTLKVDAPFRENARLSRLLGKAPDLLVEGAYDRSTSALDIHSARLALPDGLVTASGTLDTTNRALDFDTRIALPAGNLMPGIGGRLSGPVQVTGPLNAPEFVADITLRNAEGLPEFAGPLLGSTPRLTASFTAGADSADIRSAKLTGDGIAANARGRFAWYGTSDLTAAFDQTAPALIDGNAILLGAGNLRLTGPAAARQIQLTSRGGRIDIGGNTLEDVLIETTQTIETGRISGPVRLTGNHSGLPAEASARFERASGDIRLTDIKATSGPGSAEGALSLLSDGALEGGFAVSGAALSYSGVAARTLDGTIDLTRASGAALSLSGDLTAEDVGLSGSSAPLLSRASVKIRSADDGYTLAARLMSDTSQRPTDIALDGAISLAGGVPSGTLAMSGTAAGQPIRTLSPALWKLGDAPLLDVDVEALGGTVSAHIVGAGDDMRLVFDAADMDLSPLLAATGNVVQDTRLNGHGDLRMFGARPAGTFAFSATSPVPGLDTSLAFDLTGALGADALTVRLQSSYAGEIELDGSARAAVLAEAGKPVRPDMKAPLTGSARLTGDLGSLHTIALAFGHDVGGRVDASATLSGSLSAPSVTAEARVEDGTYEFGTTGFRVRDVALRSRYDGGELSLDASGKGVSGGSFTLAGRLAGDDTDLTAEVTDMLVYDRDGDFAIGTGKVTLSDSPDTRTLKGSMFLSQARFSLENLPSARPRAIDVRWQGDPPPDSDASKLRRTLALDVDLKADRRIMVAGRGLDTEWRLDLKLTGTPAAPVLRGDANLVRGDLDLAGRPFVFDRGRIDFDGPPSRARMDISAERTVNGFDARVDVTGSPLSPAFELTSSPDLPQDEILSRLLFGRSSVDLSPLEAAQLATSIARLSGRSAGFDPVSGFQEALGLDRFSISTTDSGGAEIGVGQYVSEDVYVQLKSAGAEGSSVEVEWQPRPQVSVASETHATGESKVSIRWKRDY